MVDHPRVYLWSSYKVNAEEKSELIIPDDQYLELDHRTLERRKVYRGLFKDDVKQSIDDAIRVTTNGNHVLSNTKFQKQVAEALGCRVTKGKADRPKREGDIR